LQLAGKRATADHVECRARGGATCVYHVSWK